MAGHLQESLLFSIREHTTLCFTALRGVLRGVLRCVAQQPATLGVRMRGVGFWLSPAKVATGWQAHARHGSWFAKNLTLLASFHIFDRTQFPQPHREVWASAWPARDLWLIWLLSISFRAWFSFSLLKPCLTLTLCCLPRC